MKINELFENEVPEYRGNIIVPASWKDLSKLSKKYPGYTPGCKLIGNFTCIECKSLESLKGGPSIIIGDFHCGGCSKLKSLEGSPITVTGNFDCDGCKSLESLKGGPNKVTGYFNCSNCTLLKSLEGCPTEVNNFHCSKCTSLESLEGCPTNVNMFQCSGCTLLKSLEGCPTSVNDFYCEGCTSLESYQGITKEIGNSLRIDIDDSTKKSILFVFKIKNLKQIIIMGKDKPRATISRIIANIVNKYLNNKNMIGCAEELIEAGYKEFARP